MDDTPFYTSYDGCTVHMNSSGQWYVCDPDGSVWCNDRGATTFYGSPEEAISAASA